MEYIPAHILQTSPEIFEPREPLHPSAWRAGWRGVVNNVDAIPAIGIKQVYPAA